MNSCLAFQLWLATTQVGRKAPRPLRCMVEETVPPRPTTIHTSAPTPLENRVASPHSTWYNRIVSVVPVKASRYLIIRATLLVLGALSACVSLTQPSNPTEKAEQLAAEGKHQEAIAVYERHISDRLAVSDRPEWENPYFYLLSIGDLYLSMEQPDQALKSFQEAEKQGVSADLVSDRYRALASWYVEHQQLEKALQILKTYRERDSLLFDSMLDRVARALTEQEATQVRPKKQATGTGRGR